MERIGGADYSDQTLMAINLLRTEPGFEQYTVAEASKLLKLLERLAHILHIEQASENDLNEKKLLEVVRSGEYDKITVEFRNKKMHSLTLNKEQNAKRKIVEVLKENPFQEITIKSHRGKITRFLSKLKIKLDSK